MNQLPLHIPRIRATRAPMVIVTKVHVLGKIEGYEVPSPAGRGAVVIQHDRSIFGKHRVTGFIAWVKGKPPIRTRLLRDVRATLASLYPELPRERRKRKR